MNFSAYQNYFEEVLKADHSTEPYNDPDYMEYTKLNWSRQSRWLKTGEISAALKEVVSKINKPQTWIIITEPWCGDAAHIVPFFHLIANLNPLITAEFELRDAEPHRINDYLTNGGKSIPILVVKDERGKDLFRWGPRPAEAQNLYTTLKNSNAEFEEIKIALQKWYNEDKGVSLQQEIAALLKG
ncbi:MAG: thioredoxin family protein [Bacteroidetes bacterium]|nr:thioredoxin family protein [Bacteroidota bacterium]